MMELRYWIVGLLAMITLGPAALAAEEPAAIELRATPLLATIGSFEVEQFRGPFETASRSLRGELLTDVRSVLLKELTLPKASPAQGILSLTCLDTTQECRTIQATVRTNAAQPVVVWQAKFNNLTVQSPWRWFFGVKGPVPTPEQAERIVDQLKTDYQASVNAPGGNSGN